LEKITPKEATIETIRHFERLPEKMYKRKIKLIILFDLLMLIAVAYGYYVKVKPEKLNYIINSTIKAPWMPGIHLIMYIVVYVIVPMVCLLIIRSIPYIFKNTSKFLKKLINALNPFGLRKRALRKAQRWDYNRLYRNQSPPSDEQITELERYENEERIWNKKRKKTEPFLYFRETTLGKVTRFYLVSLHIMLYLVLLVNGLVSDFVRMRDEELFFKVFTILITLAPIVYFLLSKEPKRTRDIARENLKVAFHYYLSPVGRPRLSSAEKEEFEENFDVRISYETTHYKGIFKNGVYHNQEFHYRADVHVDDLELGLSYLLRYPTDRNHQNWGIASGKERQTRGGRFELWN